MRCSKMAGAGDCRRTEGPLSSRGRSVSKKSKETLDDWRAMAARELKGKAPECLTWETPEGIAVKPLYTAADLEGLETLNSLPGFAPFVRGPRATMYAGRP